MSNILSNYETAQIRNDEPGEKAFSDVESECKQKKKCKIIRWHELEDVEAHIEKYRVSCMKKHEKAKTLLAPCDSRWLEYKLDADKVNSKFKVSIKQEDCEDVKLESLLIKRSRN